MKKILMLSFLTGLLAFTACTKKDAGAERVVNLVIWSDYVAPEIIADFEKQKGIKVRTSNYSSNEELLAKLQAGASGYDVAVPSDYMVFAMAELGLLQNIDPTKLPNFKKLDPKFLKKSYDPENKYSVPYNWGTTGIAVNRTLYKGQLRGWKDVFDNPELAGKFTLLDDVRETIGAALKYNGFSMNTKNQKELAKAKETLLKIRGKVKAFSSETKTPLIHGEYIVAHTFLPDALQSRKATNGKIEYILPEEGGTLWIDNLVVPKGAKNVNEAHELIDFLLEASNAKKTVEKIFVSPVNRDVFALLPKDVQSDPTIFPSDKVLSKFETLVDLGDSVTQWDRIWTEIKAEGN